MSKPIVRAVAVSPDLDAMIEATRLKLGMSRSAFFKYAACKLLQDLSVMTTAANKSPVTLDHS